MFKLKLLILKHKCKLLLSLIFILFILLISKGGVFYLEKKIETIPKVISYISSSDIFSDSTPFIIKEGKDGKRETTYKIDKQGNKSIYRTKIIDKAISETQLKGTLNFNKRKVEIENKVIDYVKNITNKNYPVLNNYYISFARSDITDSQKTWGMYKKIEGNLILTKTIPLYDNYSSKALTQSIFAGDYYDSIRKKKYKTFSVYSIFDNKKNEFRILNPEYIDLFIPKNKLIKTNVVEGTARNSTHNLQIKINKIFLNFPNNLLFNINTIISKDVRFNRIRVKLYKKDKLIYSKKQDVKGFDPDIYWGKTIFRKKRAYSIKFWLDISFPQENFFAIYDKLMDKGILNLNDITLTLQPINDSDISIQYPLYTFKL